MSLGRDYTKEERLYHKLLFAYKHYDGESTKAFDKCAELLKEVRESDLASDFKEHFENIFKDQVSKFHDTHKNYYEGHLQRFEALFK